MTSNERSPAYLRATLQELVEEHPERDREERTVRRGWNIVASDQEASAGPVFAALGATEVGLAGTQNSEGLNELSISAPSQVASTAVYSRATESPGSGGSEASFPQRETTTTSEVPQGEQVFGVEEASPWTMSWAYVRG